MPTPIRQVFAPLLLVQLFVSGCDAGQPPVPRIAKASQPPAYVEKGDLKALKQRGKLRILVPVNLGGGRYLPRKGSPVGYQQDAAERFAEGLGLKPRIVPVRTLAEMIPMLLEGRGDVIAANLTVTPEREERIAFTVPLAHVREQLVTRADDEALKGLPDLEGRTVAVDPASSFWRTLEDLKRKHPGIQSKALPGMRTDDIVDRVADGELDVTIQDSNVMEMYLAYRRDLRVAFDVTGERPVAWGVRPNAVQLRDALNRFLEREKLTQVQPTIYKDDLPGLKKRKVLRVLLRNNAASYFLWKGQLLGFEYDLARKFARAQKLRLEVVVPPDHQALLAWLAEGRGDIAAGFLVDTPERRALGLNFSRPYHYAPELVVSRPGENGLEGIADLAGRTLVIRRSSAYWTHLKALQERGIALKLVPAPEDMETEDIIAGVASGKYDLTVADGHILDIELTWRDDIQAAFPLGDPMPHAWAVRAGNKDLLAAINRFLKKEYKGVFYNITFKKYFTNPRRIKDHVRNRAEQRDGLPRLSPYDDLARKYGRKYGFDWLMIVAQMYQESRFDPDAKSWAGALGLMQIIPRTANHMGFDNLKDPDEGIHAGVKYLDWLRDRFDEHLPVMDRMLFTLAAYNAGAGHVHDARRLAGKLGLNNRRWFGHVEKAMLKLSKPKYARQAKYGYVRGREPVNYVRNIYDRYQAYVNLTAPVEAGADPAPPPALATR